MNLCATRRAYGLRSRGRSVTAFVFVAVVAVTGCGPVAAPERGGGPGGRPQELALSPQEEYRLGTEAFEQVLREARSKGVLVRGGPAVERVRKVGQAIADVATGQSRMSRLLRREINIHIEGYRFDWEYAVIDSDQINAFCLPAGKVVVFTGLLRFIDGRDDMLAVVLGHEIGHALAHHASERLAMAGPSGHVGLGGLSFERWQESEADHIGVFLMTFAGYDPRAAVVFWEAMSQRAGGRIPEILSDHPSDARRIAQLRMWSERALAAKRALDEGRVVPD
jgi:predicted Zn-dependent protease